MGVFSDVGTRLSAAFDVFRGKVPQPKAIMQPFFMQFYAPNMSMPTANAALSYQQLRSFSESAIPRRAIDYIRSQVARLDFEFTIKPGKKLTAQQKKKLDALRNVLASPNPDDTFQTFIGQMIEDMLVIGWGVAEVKEYPGHPEQPYILYPVDSASIQVYLDFDGNPNTRRYAQFDMRGNKRDFKPSQLLIFKQTPRSNTPFGLSPLEVVAQQVQYLLDSQVFAGRTASSATPKKLLYMGKEITEEQVKEFRSYFRESIEGSSHLPIFGGTDDIKSVELGLTGDSNLFLEWQKFLIAIIADAFGLDPMKFGISLSANRSNGDMLDDVSDESAIRPTAHLIEGVINQRLLSYFGLSDVVQFRFLFTSSYTDRKSLAVIHQIYGQLDVMTINEIRRENGWTDLPIDDRTGKSKGDLTVSEFRAAFGGQVNLNDAIGLDDDMGTSGMLSIAKETADAKSSQGVAKSGGNNGVHSAPAPKDKPSNARNDSAASVTL